MLLFGGDYNPEQWDEPTWAEDVALMHEARVNTATVGVFSWSWIAPSEGRYRFDWLDATLERLHRAGVSVILATPTASPPPWFSLAHPDALPVRADGTRLVHGSRDTYCAAAPSYRQAAVRVATKLAERYAGHPALAMWHVHNEYGTRCWCDHAAAAFRSWLQQRYGAAQPGLDELNQAWGTAFWGGSAPPPGHAMAGKPIANVGLPALLVERAAQRLCRPARRHPSPHTWHPRDYELHAARRPCS